MPGSEALTDLMLLTGGKKLQMQVLGADHISWVSVGGLRWMFLCVNTHKLSHIIVPAALAGVVKCRSSREHLLPPAHPEEEDPMVTDNPHVLMLIDDRIKSTL